MEKWAEEVGITIVSVDAPDLPRNIFCVNGTIYLRMHRRTSRYSHWYSREELEEVSKRIKEKNSKKVYVFFNNNARKMMSLLKK